MIKRMLSAFSFITVIPIKTDYFGKYTVAFFPVVGMFIGALLFLTGLLFSKTIAPSLSAFVLLLLYIIITGGFHLDGFADTVDALSGNLKYKDKFFEIMADPHIGLMGVIGLILLLIADYIALKILVETASFGVIAAAPVLARAGMVFSIHIGHPAKQNGLGKYIMSLRNWKVLFLAFISSVAFSFIFLSLFDVLILLFITAVVSIGAVVYFNQKIRGITGDILGFITELALATNLFIFAILKSYG